MNRTPRILALGLLVAAVFLVGARRGGGCGGSPRRLEVATGIGAGTTAVFFPATSSTITRGDTVAGGTFSQFQEGRWYGDDHSRLVIFENPLGPLGRVESGYFVEYRWGPDDGRDFNYVAALETDTVRNVDMGLCSVSQRWEDGGQGVGDRVVAALRGPIRTGIGYPGGVDPPLIALQIDLLANEEPRYWLTFGRTPTLESRDELCVFADLEVGAHGFTSLPGFPQIIGCVFPSLRVTVCGSFSAQSVPGSDVRLAQFAATRTSAVVNGSPYDDNGICYPLLREYGPGLIRDQIKDQLEAELTNALRGAARQRGPLPCRASDVGTFAGRQFCARSLGGAGATAAEYNSSCEQRVRSGANCELGSPQTLCGADEECVPLRNETRIPGICDGTQIPCQSDLSCASPNGPRSCLSIDPRRPRGVCHRNVACVADSDCANTGGTCLQGWCAVGSCYGDADCAFGICRNSDTVAGFCGDASPLCYWDVGVERIEVLPSALEVIVAEDDADPVLRPLRLAPALRDQLCRDATDDPFVGGVGGAEAGELRSPP